MYSAGFIENHVLVSYLFIAYEMKMGSYFKKAIFDDHVQVGLVNWADRVRNKGPKAAAEGSSERSSQGGIQLGRLNRNGKEAKSSDGAK